MTGNPLVVRHHFRLFNPASWLSFIIRKIDGCWANHSAIVIYINGKKYVVEARGSGIYLSTWENWLKHRPHKSYFEGYSDMMYPVNMSDRILSKVGVQYDTMALFVWHPLRLIFGKWWGGTAESGKMVCSEYVGWCWKQYFPTWTYLSTAEIIHSGVFTFPGLPKSK